jgi:DNA-binding IscR family transcriptional regulator
MLSVSKQADYDSVMQAYMACHTDETVIAASLAKHMLLPLSTVRKWLQMLVKSGLLS